MRFNPLWLIVLFLFLFAGGWILLAPIFLLMLLLSGGLFFAGTSARGLMKAPRQVRDMLFDARVRANLALCHAACNVLRRNGWPELTGSASAAGFFVGGIDDGNAVYEASVQALARLKNGERSLRVLPDDPTFRAVAACLLTLLFVALPGAAGGMNAVVLLAAFALAWFAAPYASPFLQGFALGGADVTGLRVRSAAFRTRAATALGGRFSAVERGVEVYTSAENIIDAEIVED